MSTASATPAPPHAEMSPDQRLMQLACGYMFTAAIYTAAKLDVAGHLARGARTATELAAATGCQEDALYRVLRALVSVGVFAEISPRIFALTPMAEPLRSDLPGNVRDLVLWVGDRFHFHTWAEMPWSVQSGRPAVEHLYGKPCFECFDSMPDVARGFNAGMTCLSSRIVPALLEAYDFSGIGTLMDVAGGHGFVLCEVLRRYPQMKGILLDMASVIEGATCRICDLKMDHRCTPVAGDFFRHIPPGADAYYLQHILHDWDDARALHILDNCRQALAGRPHARLLVVDCVLTPGSEPHFGKLLDLEMLLLPGGRERTEPEFRALFERAGLRLTRIVPMKAAESVIEARLA